MAGLDAAKARGRKGGRKPGLSKEAIEKARSARALFDDGKFTVGDIAKTLGIGRATSYRYIEFSQSLPKIEQRNRLLNR